MPQPDIATIADIMRVHAVKRPDAVALVVGERTITFAELDARSSQAAQAFRAAGVGFGDRVAFIEKNCAEFFEVVCGLAKLGAVGVPVNWRLAAPEMLHIVEDAQAKVVVVGSEFFGHVETIEDRLTTVDTVVAIGDHARWPVYDDWVAGHPAEDPGVTTGPDDVAFLMYTSGTTGLPKGVMLSNKNYFSKATGIADEWRFDADSVSLAVMPMFHMAGSGWALVGLYEGCTTVVLRDVDPAAILDAIARHRITNLLLVPAVIQIAARHTGSRGHGLLERARNRLRRLADHRRRSGEGAAAVRLRVPPGVRLDRNHRLHNATRRITIRCSAPGAAAVVRQALSVGGGADRRRQRRRRPDRHGRRAVDPVAAEHARLLEQSRGDGRDRHARRVAEDR